MAKIPDLLPTIYVSRRVRLSWHADIFGENIWGRRELVFLTFRGARRFLKFKNENGTFHSKILCTEDIGILITPIANSLYLHAKGTGLDNGASTTFAFRRGARPDEY